MVLQQDFEERRAAALEITTIRSFKYEPFFFFCGGGGDGGGGGGGGRERLGGPRFLTPMPYIINPHHRPST